MKICIFGASSNDIDEKYITATEKLAENLAKRGHSLVFGAGKHGLMGAAARGFKREGGKIYGVIPEFFREEAVEVIYTKCDEIIYTETMAQRKAKMEDLADAFLVVPGGIGTFEEFFEVLTLKQLGRHTKPIAIFDIGGYYDKLEDFMQYSTSEGFITEACSKIYFIGDNTDKLIDYIETDKTESHQLKHLKNG
jgi:uncharacterized protein (TIGR00730 family)